MHDPVEPIGERMVRVETQIASINAKLDAHIATVAAARKDANDRAELADEKLTMVLAKLATFPPDHGDQHAYITHLVQRDSERKAARDKVIGSAVLAAIGALGSAIWLHAEELIRYLKWHP